MKGALGTLAARPAAEAASRLETIAEEGDLARGEEVLAVLEKELERLEPELDALAKGGVLR